jgi:DNA primase large subunit
MPCMVQRILQPNPEHEVRLNVAVMLFNVGMTPEDVTNIYGQLGWVDFDRNVTKNYLKDIYRSGYSDMSCRTLREEKLLCVQDDPSDCSCYGWSGGEVEWQ